jgi:hypothetical protein
MYRSKLGEFGSYNEEGNGANNSHQWLRNSKPGLTNLWHAYPKCYAERFSWHATFVVCPFVLIYFAQLASLIVKNIYIYIYIYISLTA